MSDEQKSRVTALFEQVRAELAVALDRLDVEALARAAWGEAADVAQEPELDPFAARGPLPGGARGPRKGSLKSYIVRVLTGKADMAVKDITAAAVGFPMSQGSRFFAGTRSEIESSMVTRLRP